MILDALEKAIRGTMYADAYDEACREYYFAVSPIWKQVDPDQRLTIRRPTRQTEAK